MRTPIFTKTDSKIKSERRIKPDFYDRDAANLIFMDTREMMEMMREEESFDIIPTIIAPTNIFNQVHEQEQIASRLATEKLHVECKVSDAGGDCARFRFSDTTSESTLEGYINSLEELLGVKPVKSFRNGQLDVLAMNLSAVIEKLEATTSPSLKC